MKKLVLLLTGIVLLGFNALAQSGTNPIVGSTHTYVVNVDTWDNTHRWEIEDAGNNITVLDGVFPSLSEPVWINYFPASATDAADSIRITFDAGVFSDAGSPYILRYVEETGDGCSTIREITIDVDDNQFCLDAGGNYAECHDLDGTVFDWATNGSTEQQTTFTDTITVVNGAGLTITDYGFTGNIVVGGGSGNYTITGVVASSGTPSALTDLGGGAYEFTVSGATDASVVLTFTAQGYVNYAEDFTLTISNGVANVGGYNVPDNGTCNDTQVVTVNALPGASNISAD